MARTSPGLVQYTVNYLNADQRPVANVLHFNLVFDATSDRDTAVAVGAGVVFDAWDTHVMPQLTDDVVLQNVAWVDLEAVDGTTGTSQGTAGTPQPGGQAGTAAPPQVSYLVRKEVTGGRSTRSGRIYLPGVSSAAINEDGSLASITRSNVEAAVEAAFAEISAAAAPEIEAMAHVTVTWPTILDPNPPTPPRILDPDGVGDTHLVTGLTVDADVATQRLRLQRGGS